VETVGLTFPAPPDPLLRSTGQVAFSRTNGPQPQEVLHATPNSTAHSSVSASHMFTHSAPSPYFRPSLVQHGTGGILADDMGLGKTIQTIALLAQMLEEVRLGHAARHNYMHPRARSPNSHLHWCI
jgi:hypothetical protein